MAPGRCRDEIIKGPDTVCESAFKCHEAGCVVTGSDAPGGPRGGLRGRGGAGAAWQRPGLRVRMWAMEDRWGLAQLSASGRDDTKCKRVCCTWAFGMLTAKSGVSMAGVAGGAPKPSSC